MSDGSAAFAAVFLTTWVLGGEPPTTGPRFTGNELPEPPQQHSQWSAPPAQLSTNLVSSVEVLKRTDGYCQPVLASSYHSR